MNAMEDVEKIYGEYRLALLQELLAGRTPVNFRIEGTKFEKLTFVTGFKQVKTTPCLLVDRFKGLSGALSVKRNVLLNFTGGDKIRYSFKTCIHEISEHDIWLEFPQFIERNQRRRHFRVVTPLGTKVFLPKGEKTCEGHVVNLSMVGVLFKEAERSEGRPEWNVGEDMQHVQVFSIKGSASTSISVKKSRVKRVVKDPATGRCWCALHFLELDSEEERKLRDFIYMCQREDLKRRDFLTE
jgi:c-di-GMP-binding flagellar brake protein YcgR